MRQHLAKDDHGIPLAPYVPRQATGWMNPSIEIGLGILGWLMWPWFWLYDLLVRITGR